MSQAPESERSKAAEQAIERGRALAAEQAKNRPQHLEAERETLRTGIQEARARAVEGAKNRLQQAARFMAVDAKSPVWSKRMGKGGASLLLKFELPGVLAVYDPDTLHLLAISEPGRPDILRAGFMPENAPHQAAEG
jgi:hypothetical protein